MTAMDMDGEDVRMGRKPHPRYVVVLEWRGKRSQACIAVEHLAAMRGWSLGEAWDYFLGLARRDGVRPRDVELRVLDAADPEQMVLLHTVAFQVH